MRITLLLRSRYWVESFGGMISQDTGLRLVRAACDELEEQIHSLQRREKLSPAKVRTDET